MPSRECPVRPSQSHLSTSAHCACAAGAAVTAVRSPVRHAFALHSPSPVDNSQELTGNTHNCQFIITKITAATSRHGDKQNQAVA
eukprot:scaffold89228_cov68-Phaeocystis_antarctica.AAC.6